MSRAPEVERPSLGQTLAAFSLAGARVIHLIVAPEHFREWFAAGVFFVALALIQGAGAGAVLSDRIARSASFRLALSAVSGGTILLWVVSRTVGMPGPDAGMPERVGALDGASTILEAVTLLAVWMLSERWGLTTQRDRARPPARADTRSAA